MNGFKVFSLEGLEHKNLDSSFFLMAEPLLSYLKHLTPQSTGAREMIQQHLDQDMTGLLHLAAQVGNLEACQALLQLTSLAWNVLDENGKSAGQVALENGHEQLYQELVDEGVRAEFVLTALGQKFADETLVQEKNVSNAKYLQSRLVFSEGKLLDEDKNAVMMGWETPLMHLHAQLICSPGKRVLNVGFGLGIIDSILQSLEPSQHTIIEAHPDVYQRMLELGWDKKPGVKIIFGRWQDVLDQLELYDGIFFDTFGEYYDDLKEFNDVVPNILDQDGIYSFFNGLAGTNAYFHDVACRMVEIDLHDCGMAVEYQTVDVDTLGDEVWRDTKRAYWNLPTYRVPIVKFIPY